MNEQPPTSPNPAAETTSPEPVRRRRRLVVPAVVAAIALGVGGAGVGYAAVSSRQQPATATTGVQQDSGSLQLQQSQFDRYATGPTPYDEPSQPESWGDQSTDTTSRAAGSQLTGLVRIATTQEYDGATAAGTGLVLTSDGEVVTNHHVVEGATSIEVKVMSTGATYTARVVGTDATADVAVLQLEDASGLDTVTIDDDGVTTDDSVTAVGDGNGTEDYLSAATGTVLATDQSITTQSEATAEGEQLTDLIQISSDVVSGYSGGATYDADGEVVGLTTAASAGTSDPVGYAITIAKVIGIVDDLEAGKESASYDYGYPAFLGIGLASGTTVQGTYDDTPAADAGLEAGDTITSVGGIETTTAIQLQAAIGSHSPGDDVRITWTDSSGTSQGATVTLAQGPVE